MKEKTVWYEHTPAMAKDLDYWLGEITGKAAYEDYSDLRWLSFYGLEVRPYEARRSKCGKIIGDE